MSAATGSRTSRSRQKDAPSRDASPGRDEALEDMVPAGDKPVQPDDAAAAGGRRKKSAAKAPAPADEEAEDLPAGLKESDALMFKIRQANSAFYKENTRNATNAEIAEIIEEEESTVENARSSLKLARQGAKLSGLRRQALKAGFSRRKDASRAEVRGQDVEQSLITTSDVQRLAHSIPLDFSKGSYSPEEVEMRMELIHESLPVGSAREIMGFIEPLFRGVLTDCVERQSRLRTQRVTPSTMLASLKKYNELGVFSACVPPKGLVRHAKEDGIDLVNRKKEGDGYLMEVTDADKKEFKKWKSECKTAKEQFDSSIAAEKKRKADRKAAPVAEEADEEAPAPAPTAKKAKKGKAVAA